MATRAKRIHFVQGRKDNNFMKDAKGWTNNVSNAA
jgi:hypothetical protein